MCCSVAKTAAERTLGTVIGGVTGLAVRAAGELVESRFEWLLYGFAAACIGAIGVYLQDVVPQGAGAAKLLVITFMLVFAGADSVVRLLALL